MCVPAALFAFGHYLPAEAGNNAIFVAAWAGLFGLLMADVTARAGNLGPAVPDGLLPNLFARPEERQQNRLDNGFPVGGMPHIHSAIPQDTNARRSPAGTGLQAFPEITVKVAE